MNSVNMLVAATSLLASCLPALGQSLVTFEEVPRHPSNFAVRVDSSGPLSFSSPLCDPICGSAGIPVLDASVLYSGFDLSGSGPMAGIVSDGLLIWSSSGSPFTLHSANLGMSHPFDSPEIVAIGFGRDGSVYSRELLLGQFSEPVTFGWENLDALRFSVRIQSGHVVIDDIFVSVVPEPSNALMFVLGLSCIAVALRSRSDA